MLEIDTVDTVDIINTYSKIRGNSINISDCLIRSSLSRIQHQPAHPSLNVVIISYHAKFATGVIVGAPSLLCSHGFKHGRVIKEKN